MNIEELYQLYIKYYLVDSDTRRIRQNTIFFALKGDNFNGNKFAVEALAKGASYCVVDEEKYQTNSNIILVDDVLKTLQNLASYHREQLNIPIIGLTGSNGKTTTKELINAVISKKYKTTATKGNLNNHIGVPLTLLSMDKSTEIGIVEMGANHLNEIAFLSNIAKPDYGYITNFGKAHLEGFGSVEGVIKAKSELYDFLISNNKKIFVNPGDEIQVEKTKEANRILFNDTIEFIEINPFVKLLYNGIEMQSNLIGKYNFNNIAAAITIGKYFGVSDEIIKEAIENYVPDNNRSQIIKTNQNEIILDAYNANPTSMKVAIENFSLLTAKHKTLILGDMFELGRDSKEEHQSIVDFTSQYQLDKVIFVGENFFKSITNHLQFRTFDELKEHLKGNPIENNFILIKGSRGMALERTLEFIN
ncbi:UDP-N-acetylmuramoyl-tripeptide--D-alanyl-D-alanine ligase [Tenacibaculum adriaticum]|uniref:UDP-N-acetylmuramoyl-tripeptide--D-alanyl-D-alanine ligase n=1 Tax=Tenacibaculum adriaticum TaxID=413713 RepID=A0A5S5DNR9_9FLAO|nr:UDP-N-acetylmuramoyl-tripeptide--D-alanyl-D-alanine ligase [Tenacibaculum adriaticum]TYP97365.1 UDP-N-acetylmuramoyl-tripeptide--D-alanyl-D-alanine ligase [Tenacibaculum adriaticum]